MTKSDPTPRSPEQVDNDPAYIVMTNYVRGNYYPFSDEIVVKHKKSKTYWKAVYAVREDDSDYQLGAKWNKVAPKKKTIIEYQIVDDKKKGS